MSQVAALQKLADETATRLDIDWPDTLRNARRRYNEGTPEYFKIWEKSEDFVMQNIGVLPVGREYQIAGRKGV